ncbi:MAG: excinuclease ABC subunit A [Rhodobacteraceae bacterium]|nr:excinuclease ABC subunit A [Paracoccaceae bacterium]
MTLETSAAWLKIASWILIGFGLLAFFSLFTPAASILDLLFDFAFLFAEGSDVLGDKGWLLMAIAGGLMVGFGVMTLGIATRVYPGDPEAGRAIIGAGILVWFVIDSAGSIFVGAWFNAVLNGGFLALFAIPLLAYRGQSTPPLSEPL